MPATDKELGELHKQVTIALTEQVKGAEFEGEDGKVVKALPSPALLGAAIAFLKNNNITADAEGNEALRELNQKLAERRKRAIPQSSLDAAASHYAETVGAGRILQ